MKILLVVILAVISLGMFKLGEQSEHKKLLKEYEELNGCWLKFYSCECKGEK